MKPIFFNNMKLSKENTKKAKDLIEDLFNDMIENTYILTNKQLLLELNGKQIQIVVTKDQSEFID